MTPSDKNHDERVLITELLEWYSIYGRLFSLSNLAEDETQQYLWLGVSIKSLPAVKASRFRDRVQDIYTQMGDALYRWPDLRDDLRVGMNICGGWLYV